MPADTDLLVPNRWLPEHLFGVFPPKSRAQLLLLVAQQAQTTGAKEICEQLIEQVYQTFDQAGKPQVRVI
jgi:hypothetical protein